MWIWITKLRRLAGLFFKGEDPVLREYIAKRVQRIRELEERKKRSQREFLQCLRQYNEGMKQGEQQLLDAQENARKVFRQLTEELRLAEQLRVQSDASAVDMDDLYIWTQAVKEGKIEFDLNADIKACVKQLRGTSTGHADVNGADQRTTSEATVATNQVEVNTANNEVRTL